MASDRFHKAAKDGLLDVLKEATRKEANSKDDDSMTPVLWSAFEGRLDALRLLCGRGGDPDKCDQFGNTALHLASAKGHLHCVDFLIKFGVNVYSLDIDKHSAKDLAAINNRDEILRYLDTATVSFEANDRKKAKAMKEIAEKNCEKRMREYMRRQQKLENEQQAADIKFGTSNTKSSSNMLSSIKQKIWASQGNLSKVSKDNAKFSDLVGSGSSSVSGTGSISGRPATAHKLLKKHEHKNEPGGGFKIGEIEADGKRTITSLTGLQRDCQTNSEVLYVGTFSSNEENGKRGKISNIFGVDEINSDTEHDAGKISYGTLSRSFSQPDFLADLDTSSHPIDENLMHMQRPAGIFDRPVLGSIAFRRSVSAALSSHAESCSYDMISTNSTTSAIRNNTNVLKKTKPRSSFLNISDSDDSNDGESDDDSCGTCNPIQRFLAVWGLDEYINIFQKQQIDLDTLMLLTEADLKSLGLPLGPFRKLTFAIQERRNALANPGPIQDSRL